LHKKYASKGLVIAAPSLDAEGTVKKFKKDLGIQYPLLADGKALAQTYGVQAYPTMFLVGTDEKIKWKGHFKDEAFIKLLEAELAKVKVKAKEETKK